MQNICLQNIHIIEFYVYTVLSICRECVFRIFYVMAIYASTHTLKLSGVRLKFSNQQELYVKLGP